MTQTKMNAMQRVLTTLQHKEPDRVPLFLLVTMHGAKELGMSNRDYFSKAEHVVEGQLRLRERYGHDCIYPFFYAALEAEAWGGEVIYYDDGPPNAGMPPIWNVETIPSLEPPRIEETPCLVKVLEAVRMLKNRVGDQVPIIGVVMSPLSLPVMQLGFGKYIDLMYDRPELFEHLITLNEAFCADWANEQLAAGATAICYFDPVSSSTVTSREEYLKTGFPSAQRTLARIDGPTATHLASGRCLPILGDIAHTGTGVVGVGVEEDLAAVKALCKGKLTVLGNLNGIEMRRWTPEQAEEAVKEAIAEAGPGGGFILSDSHGEIPFQVPDDVLTAICDAARRWGRYPINR